MIMRSILSSSLWIINLKSFAKVVTARSVSSTPYTSIPDHLVLQSVVVFHRHGDRAQISRSPGPNFTESKSVTQVWWDSLPSVDMKRLMKAVAVTDADLQSPDPCDLSVHGSLYSGYDKSNIPYSQLTAIGSMQLFGLGQRLRERYRPLVPCTLDEASETMYLRSSNVCRTLQSLRSLLVGLFDVQNPSDCKNNHKLPNIHTIPTKAQEVIFPPSEGCYAMIKRRAEIYHPDLLRRSIEGFDELNEKVKRVMGHEQVPWLSVKEVLQAHSVHNIEYITGLNDHDRKKIDKVVGFIWGILYGDKIMNRLSIGRFIHELLENLEQLNDRKWLIYSGHDSTIVPMLCALDAYDGDFPPYASSIVMEICEDQQCNKKRVVRFVYNDQVLSCLGNKNWHDFREVVAHLTEYSISREEFDRLSESVIDCSGGGMEKEQLEEARKSQREDMKSSIGEHK